MATKIIRTCDGCGKVVDETFHSGLLTSKVKSDFPCAVSMRNGRDESTIECCSSECLAKALKPFVDQYLPKTQGPYR